MATPFSKGTTRAGFTPPPDSPYIRASRVWDERIGSARVQARNWRLAALLALIAVIVLAAGILYAQNKSTVAPYVVAVNEHGMPVQIAKIPQAYSPSDAEIANMLLTFVENVRSLSTDPVVVRQNWLKAYQFLSDRGTNQMNEWAKANDPFKLVGNKEGISIMVEIESIVKSAGSTYQVRWREILFRNGAKDTDKNWIGTFSIVVQQPTTLERLRVNPLGLYIDAFNWTEETLSTPSNANNNQQNQKDQPK